MQKGVSGGGWKAKRVLGIKYIRYQSKYIEYISLYEEGDVSGKIEKGEISCPWNSLSCGRYLRCIFFELMKNLSCEYFQIVNNLNHSDISQAFMIPNED